MKIYFARPITQYGQDIEIVDPQHLIHTSMEDFQKEIDQCACVFFSALPDGRVTAGVAKEIEYALATGKLVFEVKPYQKDSSRYMSVDDTRAFLKTVFPDRQSQIKDEAINS